MPTFRALLAAFALASVAVTTTLAAPTGPEFGKSRIRTSIEPSAQGETDTDKYEGRLLAGDRLTVSVSVKKSSDLKPALQLLDPNGNDITPELKTNKSGSRVQFRNFEVPAGQSGTYAVCVAGGLDENQDPTTGEYTAAFRVRNARPAVLKKQEIAAPGSVDHTFSAVGNSFLTVILSSKKSGSIATPTHLLDVGGNDVPGATLPTLIEEFAVRGGGKKFVLKNGVVSSGDGDYTLRLAITEGSATYNLKIKQAGNRPVHRGILKLSPLEPRLDAIQGVRRGLEGREETFAGLNLLAQDDDGNGLRVFFGDTLGTGVSVASDGLSVSVTPPAQPGLTEDVTVDVTVQNPDGQSFTLAQAFYYAPPPRITALQDLGGVAAPGGSAAGGDDLQLVGTGFSALDTVDFGGTAATVTGVPDATTILLTTPARAAGFVAVTVTDEFGRSDMTNAMFFEFVVPPQITDFNPPFGAVAGGTPITATGTDFGPSDIFRIDGVVVPFTPGGAASFTFSSPAKPTGTYNTEIEGKYGLIFPGPTFDAKAPPTITSVTPISGPFAGIEVPLLEGNPPTVVNVIGTNFRADDVVDVDGNNPTTVTFISATNFTFTVPDGSMGLADLTVTDLLSQSATETDALRYVGYDVETPARLAAPSASVDDLSAEAACLGDLDGDGSKDDLAIASTGSPGTESRYTRIFFENGSGQLVNRTSNLPGAYSDVNGAYNFSGAAIAAGDLDGVTGDEIVVAGTPIPGYYYYRYNGYGGSSYYIEIYDNGVRTLSNDGSGNFSQDQTLSATVMPYGYVYDEYASQYNLYQTDEPPFGFGDSTAVCIGDLDGDGDNDVVVGTDHYTVAFVNIPFSYVTVDPTDRTNHYAIYADISANHYEDAAGRGFYYYGSGTRILINQPFGYDNFRDITVTNMPLDATGKLASLVARGVCLGDIDNDTDLDLIITTDNPDLSVPYDIFNYLNYSTATPTTTVSTRILENDGYAVFTDTTATWLPAGTGQEWWQGNAVEVVDIVGDTNLDLVILHGQGIDAFQAAPTFGTTALRILQGNGTSFTDVTGTVIPPLPADSNDNFRGETLVCGDVNGDGLKDIVIGTRENLTRTSDGSALRSTRVLLGTATGTFAIGTGFLPGVSADRGEAGVLLLGDIAGTPQPQLISVTDTTTVSGGDFTRVFDWKR